MTNNILKYLEGLEELEKKATPAPWSVYGATGEGMYIAQYKALSNGYFELIDYAYAYDRKRQKNALFIINQRNEFPKLLSAMREMIGALEFYAKKENYNYETGALHDMVQKGLSKKPYKVLEFGERASGALQKVEQILCKKELLQAKTDGFEVVKELKKEIDNILSALNSYNGKERDEAIYKMHVLYSKLSEIKE